MKSYFTQDMEEAAKPDKLAVLYAYRNELDKSVFSVLLKYWWVMTEFPNQHNKDHLIEMFEMADKNKMVDAADEGEILKDMSEMVRVYRGVQDCDPTQQQMKIKALSWTTSKEKAQWFSSRWKNGGKVYTAIIPKKHIFIFSNARDESEVVLNPNHLIKLENVTL